MRTARIRKSANKSPDVRQGKSINVLSYKCTRAAGHLVHYLLRWGRRQYCVLTTSGSHLWNVSLLHLETGAPAAGGF